MNYSDRDGSEPLTMSEREAAYESLVENARQRGDAASLARAESALARLREAREAGTHVCGYCGHNTENPLGVCGPCSVVRNEHWTGAPMASERQSVTVTLPERILGRPWSFDDVRREAGWASNAGSGEAGDLIWAIANALLEQGLGDHCEPRVQTVECGDGCGCATDAQCPFKPTEETA